MMRVSRATAWASRCGRGSSTSSSGITTPRPHPHLLQGFRDGSTPPPRLPLPRPPPPPRAPPAGGRGSAAAPWRGLCRTRATLRYRHTGRTLSTTTTAAGTNTDHGRHREDGGVGEALSAGDGESAVTRLRRLMAGCGGALPLGVRTQLMQMAAHDSTLLRALLSSQPDTHTTGSGTAAQSDTTASLIEAVAATQPSTVLDMLVRMQKGQAGVSVEMINAAMRGCLEAQAPRAARHVFYALRHQKFAAVAPDSTSYSLGIQAIGRAGQLKDVWHMINEAERSVPINGRLVASMVTALAHKHAYDDALRLARRLQAAHPQLTEQFHALEVQCGLIKASAVKGDLRACLHAAHQLHRLSGSRPSVDVFTSILQCYSRSPLFAEERALLLHYISSLGSATPVDQSQPQTLNFISTLTSSPAVSSSQQHMTAWQYAIHNALANSPKTSLSSKAPSTDVKVDPGDGALLLMEEMLRTDNSFLHESLSIQQLNPVIYTLIRLGQTDRALKLVDDMQAGGVHPDIATHNIILKGFALRGNATEAVRYYNSMLQKGVKPTKKTFEALLRVQSEVVTREFGAAQPPPLLSAQKYAEITSLVRSSTSHHIQDAYSQLLQEMKSQGVKGEVSFLRRLIYGLCVAGLVDHALPLVASAAVPRKGKPASLDVRVFNTLLLGISQREPISSAMVAQVIDLMKSSRVAPSIPTYTILLNIYAKQTRDILQSSTDNKGFIRGGDLEDRKREDMRNTFIKALSVYLSVRVQAHAAQASHTSGPGPDLALINSLAQLVGADDALAITCEDIDALQEQHEAASKQAPEPSSTLEWTQLPLNELQRRFFEQPLPWPEFVPQSCSASRMTPVELLFWRDMAAHRLRPDRVSYNHLINLLTASGQLSRAEQYLRFILDRQAEKTPESNEPSPLPAASFLPRSVNLKYESVLIRQRHDRQAQLQRLLSKTPRVASDPVVPMPMLPTSTAVNEPHAEPSTTTVGPASSILDDDRRQIEKALLSDELETKGEGTPLFLRTLWQLGGEYLRVKQFENFTGCYRLALQGYPLSATKCFGFLVKAWRSRDRPGPTTEMDFLAALQRHQLTDPDISLSHAPV